MFVRPIPCRCQPRVRDLTGQSLAPLARKCNLLSQSGARPKIGPVKSLFNRPIDLIRNHLSSISHSGHDWPVKRNMKVEASAIQPQNGRHLSILVRKARGPFVGQDGILLPSGTRRFPAPQRGLATHGPSHKRRVAKSCQPVCDPAPQGAGDSTFMSRTSEPRPYRER